MSAVEPARAAASPAAGSRPARVFRFEEFELDEGRFELRRAGSPVRVQPKVARLLLYLVRHRDRVVSREELLDRLWPGVAVNEEALSRAVYAARRVLGDDGVSQRLIRTVRGSGFCFAARVVGESGPARRTEPASRERVDVAGPPLGRSPFVGREALIHHFLDAADEAARGRGRLFLLSGEAGMGKSRTAEELAGRARARDLLTFTGWCHEGDGAPPFWPWIQILRAAVRESEVAAGTGEPFGDGAVEIARLLAAVRPRVPGRGESLQRNHERDRFQLFDGVATFLRELSRRNALVIVLDDLHRADRTSLLLLEFLAHELRTSRILVLCTWRDEEVNGDHPLSITLVELGRHAPCERAALRGLAMAEVKRFLELTLGLDESDRLAQLLHAKAEGNPLFLTELLRLLQADGWVGGAGAVDPGRLRVPRTVKEVLGRRLARLSHRCRRLLMDAAVIGRDFSLRELAAVSRLSAESVLRALDPAVAGRIVAETGRAQYRFTHVLIRDTLYEALPRLGRLRRHQRVGEALERLYGSAPGPQSAALAHHFLESSPAGGYRRALDHAARAGEWSTRGLAHEEAARHYRSALEIEAQAELPDSTRRSDLLLCLGESQVRAGERAAAKCTFREAAALARSAGSVERLARAALSYAPVTFAIETGVVDLELVDLLEEAIEAAGPTPSRVRALLLARLVLELQWTNDEERRLRLSSESVAIAERLGDHATRAYALSARHTALWTPDSLEERLALTDEIVQLAARAGDRETWLVYRIFRMAGLMEKGDLERVRGEIGAIGQLAEELRQPQLAWWARVFRSLDALHEGRLAEADSLIQEHHAAWSRFQDENAFQVFAFYTSAVRAEQGRADEAIPVVEQTVERYPRVPTWRPVLAWMCSEADRPAEAKAQFEYFAGESFRNLPRDMNWHLGMAFLTEACEYLGDARRAATLYELWRPYAERYIVIGFSAAWWGSVARYLGRLATVLERFEEAERHFELALARNARIAARPWIAHTQLNYARMLLARGRRRDVRRARALARDALETARALSLRALATRAAALARRAGRA